MPAKKNNQKGVILLLALLIMTAVVSIAIGLSVLIVKQYEFSSNLDHALVALYAAESGFEEGLFIIKNNREVGTIGVALAAVKKEGQLNEVSGASWDTQGSNIEED